MMRWNEMNRTSESLAKLRMVLVRTCLAICLLAVTSNAFGQTSITIDPNGVLATHRILNDPPSTQAVGYGTGIRTVSLSDGGYFIHMGSASYIPFFVSSGTVSSSDARLNASGTTVTFATTTVTIDPNGYEATYKVTDDPHSVQYAGSGAGVRNIALIDGNYTIDAGSTDADITLNVNNGVVSSSDPQLAISGSTATFVTNPIALSPQDTSMTYRLVDNPSTRQVVGWATGVRTVSLLNGDYRFDALTNSPSDFDFSVSSGNVSYDCSTVSYAGGNGTPQLVICNGTCPDAPTAVGQDISVTLTGPSVTIAAEDVDGGSYDNCGIVSMLVSPSTFTAAGNHAATLLVTDGNSNTSGANVTVTVTGGSSNFYSQNVYVENETAETLKSTDDVIPLLNQATALTFTKITPPTTPPTQGIFLLESNSTLIPTAWQTDVATLNAMESGEAFLIRNDGTDRLYIIGNTDRAINHGLYYYMNQLGFRFLIPNENWTIVPSLTSITLTIDETKAPFALGRNLFATGGDYSPTWPIWDAVAGLGTPVANSIRDRWWRFHRRNMWEQQHRGDIKMGGHGWFSSSPLYIPTIDATPDWRAIVDGVLQDRSNGHIKFCISERGHFTGPDVTGTPPSTGFVQAYTDAVIARMQKAITDHGTDSPLAQSISVDPTDGGGHCNDAECLAFGSVSDRIFWLANKNAQALNAEATTNPDFAGKYINLLAYNYHTDPPTFPLEPNVIVQVCYSLTRSSLGLFGDDLLNQWIAAQPTARLGTYDYWGYTDISYGLPVVREDLAVNRFQTWEQKGIKFITLESTHSAGALAMQMYLIHNLSWNPNADVNALKDDFYASAFGTGAAQTHMRTMIERWGNRFLLSEHEVALSFKNIDDALDALPTGPSAIRTRIYDYAMYVQYMRLYYEYLATPPHNLALPAPDDYDDARSAAMVELLKHTWRMIETSMIHTGRLCVQELLQLEQTGGQNLNPIVNVWNKVITPPTPGDHWDSLLATMPIPESEIQTMVDDGVADLTPLNFTQITYSDQLQPLTTPTGLPSNLIAWPQWAGSVDYVYHRSSPTDTSDITINMYFNSTSGVEYVASLFDPQNNFITSIPFPADQVARNYSLPAALDGSGNTITGNYTLKVKDPANHQIQTQANIPFARIVRGVHNDYAAGNRSYFYVPTGLTQIAMYIPDGPLSMYVYNPSNQLVYTDPNPSVGKIALIPVPTGQDGQVWSLSHFGTNDDIVMLNVPQVFSPSPDTMMVPVDAP